MFSRTILDAILESMWNKLPIRGVGRTPLYNEYTNMCFNIAIL